jgi:hypothetical protein
MMRLSDRRQGGHNGHIICHAVLQFLEHRPLPLIQPCGDLAFGPQLVRGFEHEMEQCNIDADDESVKAKRERGLHVHPEGTEGRDEIIPGRDPG